MNGGKGEVAGVCKGGKGGKGGNGGNGGNAAKAIGVTTGEVVVLAKAGDHE